MGGDVRTLSIALLVAFLAACTAAEPDHRSGLVHLGGTWIVRNPTRGSLCYGVRVQGKGEPQPDALFYWAPARSGCTRRSSGIVPVPAHRRVATTGQLVLMAKIGMIAGGFTHVLLWVKARDGDTAEGILIDDGHNGEVQLHRVDRLRVRLGLPPVDGSSAG